jgi:threonine/homoserine/homoserine lactone efflux protein
LNASESDANRIRIVSMRRKGPSAKPRFQSFNPMAPATHADASRFARTPAQAFKTMSTPIGQGSRHARNLTGAAMGDHGVLSSEYGRALLTLVLSSTIVMGSPGPSTMSVMACGAAFGLRRSLAYMSGLIVGTIAVLCAIATGLVAMLWSLPELAPLLTFAATLYIVYLAFRIATAPPPSKPGAGAVVPSFVPGFLLAIGNPKAYFAITSVFASATLSDQSHALDAGLKAIVLSIMIVVIHVCWLLGGASLTGFLTDPLRSRIANVIFAGILIGTAMLPWLR